MNNTPDRKRSLKRAAKFVLILVAVCLVATFALHFFFPGERIRGIITQELSRRLNLNVTIEKVSVGFYPGIELVARGISVTDRETGEEIVSARKVRLDPDLLELSKRKYVLEDIVVSSIKLDLVRAADGKWNVEKLIRGMQSEQKISKEKKDAEQPLSKLEISPIRIRNGAVRFRDEGSGRLLSVGKIRATADLKGENFQINSASLSLPPLEANLSGTVSQIAGPTPVLDIKAKMRVIKKGPLANFRATDLPEYSTLADISAKALGPAEEIALKGTFSLNQLITGGIPTNGRFMGTLKTEKGVLEIATLDSHFGDSTLSLSGICSSVWADERTGSFEVTGRISPEDVLSLTSPGLVPTIEPRGAVDTSITIKVSGEQADLQANLDLTDAGLVIPKLITKEPGTPGSLVANANCIIPDEIIIDSFEFAIGKAKLDGKAIIRPGAEPWAQAYLSASHFPLESLDQLSSINFEKGTASLAAEIWQSNAAEGKINNMGEATIENALLATRILKEPVENLHANIKWKNQEVSLLSASFLFSKSSCRANAELSDFSNPRVVGSLHADVLNIDEIAHAFAKTETDTEESASIEPQIRPGFSIEMLVEADSIYAAEVRTGVTSAIWQTSGESHTFDQFQTKFCEGELRGSCKLTPSEKGMLWAAEFTGQDMKLEDISAQFQTGKARVTGLLSAKGNLAGIAASQTEDVLRSMEGDLRLTITNGEIRQSSVLKSIYLLMQLPIGPALLPGVRELAAINTLIDAAKTRGRSLDPSRTTFSKMDGAFHLADGVARTEDLRLESATANLLCRGDIDLVRYSLDMKITATPLGSMSSLMGKVPLAGEKLKKAKEAVLSTDFIVRGPIEDPEVKLAVMEKLRPKPNKD